MGEDPESDQWAVLPRKMGANAIGGYVKWYMHVARKQSEEYLRRG